MAISPTHFVRNSVNSSLPGSTSRSKAKDALSCFETSEQDLSSMLLSTQDETSAAVEEKTPVVRRLFDAIFSYRKAAGETCISKGK